MSLKDILLGFMNDTNETESIELTLDLLKQATMKDIFVILYLKNVKRCRVMPDNDIFDEMIQKGENYLSITIPVKMTNIDEIIVLLTEIMPSRYTRISHDDELIYNGTRNIACEHSDLYCELINEFNLSHICDIRNIVRVLGIRNKIQTENAIDNYLNPTYIKSARS